MHTRRRKRPGRPQSDNHLQLRHPCLRCMLWWRLSLQLGRTSARSSARRLWLLARGRPVYICRASSSGWRACVRACRGDVRFKCTVHCILRNARRFFLRAHAHAHGTRKRHTCIATARIQAHGEEGGWCSRSSRHHVCATGMMIAALKMACH